MTSRHSPALRPSTAEEVQRTEISGEGPAARAEALVAALARRHSLDDAERRRVCSLFRGFAREAWAPGRAVRRPSLHHDGTPLQLSASLTSSGGRGLRFIVEPGPLTEPIPDQIERTLRSLAAACATLQWPHAPEMVSTLAASLLPVDRHDTLEWWGGLWTGVVALDGRIGLRVYVNLRSGTALDRWRRVGRLFAALSGEPTCGALRMIVERASEHARPVGVGLDLVEGRAHRIKVYVSPEHLSPALAVHLLGQDAEAETLVQAFAFPHVSPDEAPPYATTISFDVSLAGDLDAAALQRAKLDVDAARLYPDDAAALHAVRALASEHGLDDRDLDHLLHVVAALPGSNDAPPRPASRVIQYLGIGLHGGVTNVNVYARPSNLDRMG